MGRRWFLVSVFGFCAVGVSLAGLLLWSARTLLWRAPCALSLTPVWPRGFFLFAVKTGRRRKAGEADQKPGMSATEAQLGLEFQLELECALESEFECGFEFELNHHSFGERFELEFGFEFAAFEIDFEFEREFEFERVMFPPCAHPPVTPLREGEGAESLHPGTMPVPYPVPAACPLALDPSGREGTQRGAPQGHPRMQNADPCGRAGHGPSKEPLSVDVPA